MRGVRVAAVVVLAVVAFVSAGEPVRCVTWPGSGIGTEISCAKVCEKVCQGLASCPCNANEQSGSGCYVPEPAARETCQALKECEVVSHHRGEGREDLSGWAHLGSLPVAKKRDWEATVCHKEPEARGCYECETECSRELREPCFAKSYPSQYYEQNARFCAVDGNLTGQPCAAAAEAGCCKFNQNARCDPDTGACVANKPRCGDSVVVELLRSTQKDHCAKMIQQINSRNRPDSGAVYQCLSQSNLPIEYHNRFDCSILSRTKTLKELAIAAREKPPCTQLDECSGCEKYRPTTTATKFSTLTDADNPNIRSKCGFHSIRNECVVVGVGGVLQPFKPCVAVGMEHSTARDWYYLEHDPKSPQGVLDRDFTIPEVRELRKPIQPANPAASPEPLADTRPIPVDTSVSELGSGPIHRQFLDSTNRTMNVVLSCVSFPDIGTIEEWSVYAGKPGRLHVQVLRPTAVPSNLADNPEPIQAFSVVGENVLKINHIGEQRFEIPMQERLDVQPGDVVGFYSTGGMLSWSAGGEKVLWRYGKPTAPTKQTNLMLQTLTVSSEGPLLFVGSGTSRTYSLSLKGKFPGHVVRESATPSQLPSVTPVASTSIEPSMSVSASVSPTPSPSGSVSATAAIDACLGGPQYWCLNEYRRVKCKISVSVFTAACRLPKPSPFVCPLAPICPPGSEVKQVNMSRCFDPRKDCHVIPDKAVKKYTYHQGGSDWDGLCATGKQQSPIKIQWDIVEVEATSMQFVQLNYKSVVVPLAHDGMSLTLTGDFGNIQLGGKTYTANSIKIKSPAEHQIEGVPRSPLELQISHSRKFSELTGETLIVSVLFDEGASSDSVGMMALLGSPAAAAAAALPGSQLEPSVPVTMDLGLIVSGDKANAWYSGSLTTPPCSEGVTWVIQMGQNQRLTKSQIEMVDNIFRHNAAFAGGRGNNRAIQNPNNRTVTLRSACGKNGAIACPTSSSQPATADDLDSLESNTLFSDSV